jgi:hypothetical protein
MDLYIPVFKFWTSDEKIKESELNGSIPSSRMLRLVALVRTDV